MVFERMFELEVSKSHEGTYDIEATVPQPSTLPNPLQHE
jgi:hypothetical protein